MIAMSLEEIREMVIFCKQQKVKNMQLGDVRFEISEAAFYEEYEQSPTKQKEELTSSKTLTDTNLNEQTEDDEEALFWSSKS